MQQTITSDLCLHRTGRRQEERHLASLVRSTIESDHSGSLCHHKSTLRDPTLSQSLEGERVLQSAGFGDGKKPVAEQEGATSTSSNTQQG